MITGFWQKLGFWPTSLINTWKSKENWLWFHAVSVGELNAVWPLILKVKEKSTTYPIMISCTTKAGYNLARELTKEKDILIFYFPFDIPKIISSLLNHAKVKILIIAETEIWPFTLLECYRRNIPIILVNARLSNKSFKNYKLFKFFFKKIINLFTKVITQSNTDSTRFKDLGLDSKKIISLCNLKFATLASTDFSSNNNLKTNITNIIFASTHNSEEELAIEIFSKLLLDFPDIRLIIAPRHIDRINRIINIIKQNNFIPILKTDNLELKSPKEILILNTIGELQEFYKKSHITILGGTFARIGGHNIIEPIRAKSYTIIGPNDFKISELTKQFKDKNAIVQVKNKDELIQAIKEALSNKHLREKVIENGLNIIKENAKVLDKTSETIFSYL
ncbi:MAG: hypothetical protein HYY52_08930 [Candidatus Melainabacteria bacterium]|nr:hypothetical protein [Candidatus Melainabacteria bacterium]